MAKTKKEKPVLEGLAKFNRVSMPMNIFFHHRCSMLRHPADLRYYYLAY